MIPRKFTRYWALFNILDLPLHADGIRQFSQWPPDNAATHGDLASATSRYVVSIAMDEGHVMKYQTCELRTKI